MSENKKLARNTIMLYIRMIVTLTISLYTSRVVLRVLGFDDYGIFNVVCGVVTMFGSISGSIGSSSNRFLMVSIGKKNIDDTNKVFNLALLIHVGLAVIVLLLCEAIGLYFLYNELVLPESRLNSAFWVFQFSLISLVISFVSLPYNSLIVAHEDMDIFAYITLADVILKLLVVFLLQYINADKLIVYGVLLLGVQIFINLIYFIVCRWKYVESSLLYYWDRLKAKEMLLYTTWIFWGFITGTVYAQGLNILLNVFYGPVVNAAQGIAVQVQSTVQRFSQNFQTALQPQLTKAYTTSDHDRVSFLVVIGSKLSFFLMFIIALPIAIQVGPILKIWLGNYPPYTESFVILLLINIIIRIFASPLMIAIQANGDIKKVQLWEGAIILTLPISYLALKFYCIEPYYVYIINVFFEFLVLFIRVHIILPKIKMTVVTYLSGVCWPIFKIVLLVTPLSFFLVNIIKMNDFPKLVLGTLIILIIASTISYEVGLNKDEKSMVRYVLTKAYYRVVKKSTCNNNES